MLCDAAAQSIGYKSRNHQDWFDDNSDAIHNLLKDMHKAHRATLKKPSSTKTRQFLQEIWGKVQRETRAMQNEWWIEKAHEIQSFANTNYMHNFYNAIKTIYGPTNRCIASLKTADGLTLLKGQHRILLRWAEHFNILIRILMWNPPFWTNCLNSLPQSQPTNNLSGGSIICKNNKYPGTDNIPAELLKEGGAYICMRTLYRYITQAWSDENISQQWRNANIAVIYKNKGD